MSIFNGREVIWSPNPGPQTAFLASPAREVFYGGAAAGGKTDAILAGAIRYADHPLHRAILFRRTRPQLQEVIDRTQVLYPEIIPGAEWIERESRWRFPSGAFVQMGYAEHEDDILKFKTFEYNYIGFDELTSFTQKMYTFMFSRNRSKSRDLPLQMRAGSNPGDIGHEWVFNRFMRNRFVYRIYEEKEKLQVGNKNFDVQFTRQFIPAKISDNPKLPDPEGYIAGLLQMGEEGAMYLHGAWVRIGGVMFKLLPQEVAPRLLDSNYYLIMSFDYGLSDPNAVYWHVVYPDKDVVDTVAELYVNELNLDDLLKKIREKEEALGLPTPVLRVGDPKIFTRQSDKRSIASILDDKGLSVIPANNDRIAGWAQMQRYIWAKKWRVWQDAAPELMRTMPNLMKHATKANDLKDHQEDHPVDSARYGLMAVYENAAQAVLSQPRVNEANRDDVFDKMTDDLRKGKRDEEISGLGIWS